MSQATIFFWNLRCFFSWTLFCFVFCMHSLQVTINTNLLAECMHPPACMNGRKKISRPKKWPYFAPFRGAKKWHEKKIKKKLNRPRRHWWAPLGSLTPSWRPPDHILPPSLTFLPSAAPSPSNVENNINSRKKYHNIPKIPPKFSIFDPHILKEYHSDFSIFFLWVSPYQ